MTQFVFGAAYTDYSFVQATFESPITAPSPYRKSIFQVAYREEHFLARANLLRRQGYTVTSTIGNEAAKAVLPMLPQVDLLIIGHAAPEQTRLDMVAWLSEHYPRTSIVALNPSHEGLGKLLFNECIIHHRLGCP